MKKKNLIKESSRLNTDADNTGFTINQKDPFIRRPVTKSSINIRILTLESNQNIHYWIVRIVNPTLYLKYFQCLL